MATSKIKMTGFKDASSLIVWDTTKIENSANIKAFSDGKLLYITGMAKLVDGSSPQGLVIGQLSSAVNVRDGSVLMVTIDPNITSSSVKAVSTYLYYIANTRNIRIVNDGSAAIGAVTANNSFVINGAFEIVQLHGNKHRAINEMASSKIPFNTMIGAPKGLTGIDLNDIKEAGFYFYSAANVTNPPWALGITTMMVMRYNGDWVYQEALQFSSGSIGSRKYRVFTNGTTWSNWTQL